MRYIVWGTVRLPVCFEVEAESEGQALHFAKRATQDASLPLFGEPGEFNAKWYVDSLADGEYEEGFDVERDPRQKLVG